MSSANVKDIQALEALRSALLKFKSDADSSLYAMQAESRRTIAWLQERLQYWQRERQRRIENLQQARAALAYCMRGERDCSREASMVQHAQRALAEAEQRLQTVQAHLKQVNNAFEEFEREARRLTNIFGNELQQGIALLSRDFGTLSTYASGVASSAGSIGHSGATVPTPGGTAIGTSPAAILKGGRINLNDLMRIVPLGTPNTFIPSTRLPNGFKFQFTVNSVKYEVKFHEPDPGAPPSSNSRNGWTAQIRIGGEFLRQDGTMAQDQTENAVHIPFDL